MVTLNLNFSVLGIFQLVVAAVFLIWGFLTVWSSTFKENAPVVFTYGLILIGMAIILASLASVDHKQQELLDLGKLKK
jgi:uncharacterized membrane protein